jgi:hypothetical protein
LLFAALGAFSCAGAAAPTPVVPSAAPRFEITERAETGPVTSIAFRAPILYAGTARGLRRWDVTNDEYEDLDSTAGLLGKAVTAVGIDGDRNVWVATDAGVGRLVPKDGVWKYSPMGGLGGITSLVPTADGRTAWAGSDDGLFRSDGTSWSPVGALQKVPVSSLDVDADGRSAWVGTRGRGLFRVEGETAKLIPSGGESMELVEIVGTGITSVGTRVVGARSLTGAGGQIIFLEQGEPQAFRAQPDVRVVRVVDSGKDAVLVAGPEGQERAYTLKLLRAGEAPPPGGLRFVSVKKGMAAARARDRWAAVPMDVVLPPGVTEAAGGEGDVFYGTARMGVARGAKGRPDYLSGAGLVGDAERFTVACATPARCWVVTDGPRAWLTDGDTYRQTRVGEADGGAALAVVTDRAGTIYALAREPGFSGLVVTRLAHASPAPATSTEGGDMWRSFERVPLTLPKGTTAGVSFAAVSPAGTLWIGVRAISAGGDGEGVSAGAVELDLANHHAVHHRGLAAGEKGSAEMLPLPAALTGVAFDAPALWFSSLSGVSRWQQGELRTWGENEGLRSELVHGVARGPDDLLWAATSEGVGRFDGKEWRMVGDGEEAIVASRALTRDAAGRLWVATSRGLRLVTAADAKAQRAGELVLAGDMRDVTLDRHGRIWALSSASIALVDPGR